MKKKEEMTTEELRELLKGKVLTLDCGHRFQLHPFSNTMIVNADGRTH